MAISDTLTVYDKHASNYEYLIKDCMGYIDQDMICKVLERIFPEKEKRSDI